MGIAKGEAVEAELNRLMEKHTAWEMDADERNESWKASVAAYNARKREENRLAWCEYFCRLAGTLRARAKEYDQRAQMLMEAQPKGAA